MHNANCVNGRLRSLLCQYVDYFNSVDDEIYRQHIPNSGALAFLQDNIPLFECPDKDIEQTYYFRWWSYRKHIKQTEDGFVITEFLPEMQWAGKHNTISCPAGHHFYEGRWLRDRKYLNDYARFWFAGGSPRSYSFWAADAIYAYYLVSGSKALVVELLDDLIANYNSWQAGWDYEYRQVVYRVGRHDNGGFFSVDDRDGAENSISGHGFRPTLNSYMFGDAMAIAKIAKLAGRDDIAEEFAAKAAELKSFVQDKLWDSKANFFKVLSETTGQLADVRELLGYNPWYFNLPDDGYQEAWRAVMDEEGFYAPLGLTTAEQRHPKFCLQHEAPVCACYWDGPSWPFETSKCLTAMANLLCNYQQDVVSKEDYFAVLNSYSKSQRIQLDNGKTIPWIDESINPFTGQWQARKDRIDRFRILNEADPTKERGKDYNHSSYCDLIISGLVGLRPKDGNSLVVNPLVPDAAWDWFCLSNVPYHNKTITITWDRSGEKYGLGSGLTVLADGVKVAFNKDLRTLTVAL